MEGLKTAVLVNEFGIDNELIVTTGEDMVELNNGCICCTINNDLVEAVYKVLERQSKDYLVVETTGLPIPPATLTFLGTGLRDLTRLFDYPVVDAKQQPTSLLAPPANPPMVISFCSTRQNLGGKPGQILGFWLVPCTVFCSPEHEITTIQHDHDHAQQSPRPRA